MEMHALTHANACGKRNCGGELTDTKTSCSQLRNHHSRPQVTSLRVVPPPSSVYRPWPRPCALASCCITYPPHLPGAFPRPPPHPAGLTHYRPRQMRPSSSAPPPPSHPMGDWNSVLPNPIPWLSPLVSLSTFTSLCPHFPHSFIILPAPGVRHCSLPHEYKMNWSLSDTVYSEHRALVPVLALV